MFLVFGVLLFVMVGFPAISLEMNAGVRVGPVDDRFVSTGTYDVKEQADVNQMTGAQIIGLVSQVSGKNLIGSMAENGRTYTDVPLSNQANTNFILYIDGVKIDQSTPTNSLNFSAVPTNSYTLTYSKDSASGKTIVNAKHN